MSQKLLGIVRKMNKTPPPPPPPPPDETLL